MGFNKGDRVKHKKFGNGTIICKDKGSSLPYLVEFDNEHNDLHNGCGYGEENHCYWYQKHNLQKLQNKTIELDDLQFADILTLRNGERYVVAEEYMYGEDNSYYANCDSLESCYNNDLTRNGDRDYDIMKVERAGQVIYEREEVKEMTIAEISEELGYEVKVVKEHE